MRKLFLVIGLLVLAVVFGANGVRATMVVDIGPSYPVPGEISRPAQSPYTQVEAWISGQTPGNGYAGSGSFYDVIGNRFATDAMSVSAESGSPFTIKLWTNNQPGGWTIGNKNWGVADIAINADSTTAAYDDYTSKHFPNAVSRFDWGINMQAYASGKPRQAGSGTAYLAKVSKWETSFKHANPIGGLIYGGAYKANTSASGSELAPIETNMLDYQIYYTGTISWVVNDPTFNTNNDKPDYLITIEFPGTFFTGNFEYLWATAKCANDVIIVTPLPPSLLLLGSALMRLAGFGWRRRSQ